MQMGGGSINRHDQLGTITWLSLYRFSPLALSRVMNHWFDSRSNDGYGLNIRYANTSLAGA